MSFNKPDSTCYKMSEMPPEVDTCIGHYITYL